MGFLNRIFRSSTTNRVKALDESISNLRLGIFGRLLRKYRKTHGETQGSLLCAAILNEALVEEPTNDDARRNNVQPSGSNHPIFYAPLLSAAGYPDGRWIVGFQRNIGGWNNMDICTSDRGCGTVNAASDDQFLAGVSASADGYWVSCHTYCKAITRSLPLMTQALYFKTGASGIGATTNMGCSAQNCIDPTSWALSGTAGVLPTSRCLTSQCYALGDFDTPSSNQFAASHTPYLVRSSRLNDLFQAFVQDPSGTANVPNFVPNFIYHPIGSDLSFEGLPVPPESWAVDPRLW